MSLLDKLSEITATDTNTFKRVEIPLYKALAAAGSDFDTYKVPAQYKLAIEKIAAHVALIDLVNEPLAIGNVNNLQSISERIVAKAMNARVTLKNDDTGINIIGENHPMNLGSLVSPSRYEIDYTNDDAPQVILPGQTLRMDVTLIQSGAGVIGANTEYGLIVTGLLVRVKGD